MCHETGLGNSEPYTKRQGGIRYQWSSSVKHNNCLWIFFFFFFFFVLYLPSKEATNYHYSTVKNGIKSMN